MKSFLRIVSADAAAYSGGAVLSPIGVCTQFRHPGLRMSTRFRVAQALQKARVPLAPQLLRQSIVTTFGCDISLSAELGGGIRFPHPVGIVIGDRVVTETGVAIYQNTTLGGNGSQRGETGRQTPRLGRDVVVAPGAVVLGPIHLDNGRKVPANAVVHLDRAGHH